MSEKWIKLIPTDPIQRAFWEGWYASAQSHCNAYWGRKFDTWKQAWRKSMSKRSNDQEAK